MVDVLGGVSFQRGQRIGKYEIVTQLSVGGMAEVFLVFAAGPGGFLKLFALKKILPNFRDDHFVKMFIEEARITAELSHSNIAQVFELGKEQGELYLAMEFLNGQNLKQIQQAALKQQRTLPLGFVARVVHDTCLGLHFAHHFVDATGKAMPVVHRDINPKNVMVDYNGRVKVVDFGIAKATGSLVQTQKGKVRGTPGYMSPEQVEGAELDGRSDLFCAGILLHELLCGRQLFTGNDRGEVMLKIAATDVTSPAKINPRVPRALAKVVLRALEKDPAKRFATGHEMARAIKAACGKKFYREEQMASVMHELFSDEKEKMRVLLNSIYEFKNRVEYRSARTGPARWHPQSQVSAPYAGRSP